MARWCLALVLPVALLAACERSGEELGGSAPELTPSPAAGPLASPVPGSPDGVGNLGVLSTLEGEYRVAGVDGGDIDLPHGISASISEDRIAVSSQCVEMAWSYRFEGDQLSTEAIPLVTCDRARYPEEEAIDAAFTSAREVERTTSNGLRFSGGGRSVTLFSQ
jgi:hypothetical protein